MRLGALLTTVVGIGVAGGAVYVAQTNFNSQVQASEEAKVVRVIAAAEDIAFGAQIQSHMLTSIEWPVGSVPPGVFTSYSQVVPQDGQDLRRTTSALVQGEVILASKVSDFGEKVTIVQTLSENSRAMAISVNAQSGVGGFVTPGDRVDIVMTQGRGTSLRAMTILQNIRIIGVDQMSDEQNEQPGVARTVTVEVTPAQGQKLALAQQAGRLSLSLRSLDNQETADLNATQLSDLLIDLNPEPEIEEKPEPVITVDTSENDQSQEELVEEEVAEVEEEVVEKPQVRTVVVRRGVGVSELVVVK